MKVFLRRGSERKENLKGVLELAFSDGKISGFRRVLIKPNLTGFCVEYANTHPEAVNAVASFLLDYGVEEIIIGEGSGSAHFKGRSTWDIFECMGYKEILHLPKTKLLNFDEEEHPIEIEVDTIYGKDVARVAETDFDLIISLAIPKTHDVAVATGGLKNMMGLIHPEDRIKIHGINNENLRRGDYTYMDMVKRIHGNLKRFFEKVKPHLVVIDGLYGMEGDGPIGGVPVLHEFAIASFDPVAADSAVFKFMGFSPLDVGYLLYAQKLGLGKIDFEIVGDSTEGLFKKYKPHRRIEEQLRWKD
jgi:uncharacterized protein (DUF362 family)